MTLSTNDDSLHAMLSNIFSHTLEALGESREYELGVELVDEDTIRTLNADTRGIDQVTDVLSFPTLNARPGEKVDFNKYFYDIDPQTHELYLGDIVICRQRAAEQAKDYGHTLEREYGFLTVHGILHLFGYDHETEDDKRLMREREEFILSACGLERE